MRKYRGKRIDTGEWVVGWYFQNAADQDIIIEVQNLPQTMSDPLGDRQSVYHHVYGKTVGQDIGLKDKNGREIFEGDVDFRILKVEYRDQCYHLVNSLDQTYDYIFMYDRIDLDIIGNIHDNPDLISR